MSMTIVLKTKLFRGDWDQARSQYSILWFMEALCRVDQSHIRQMKHLAEKGKTEPYPRIYKSGIHYERERGTEEWLDIPTVLEGGSYPGEYPGPWGDCLPLSTLIMKNDYSLVPISSLVPGDRIMGDSEWTTVVEQMETGVKKILAFELDNGSVFRCSPNHRLFKEDGTEIRAEDVKPGDHLLTPVKPFPTAEVPHSDPVLSDKDFAWLMGIFVADGWCDMPRHPRFSISGKDGLRKEEQKHRVENMMEKAGIPIRWHDKYIRVNDKRLATIMSTCGRGAPNKQLPFLDFSKEQVAELVEGLSADAYVRQRKGREEVTFGTTSQTLALQLRILYRMMNKSVHIRRWDEHGGLGSNPIYRIGIRATPEELMRPNRAKVSARVVGIREDGEEMCCDIETDTGKFWLPETDLVVHNCEDLACWRVAELRELEWHWAFPRRLKDGRTVIDHIDCAFPPPKGARKVKGGIKAKPFAKFKQRDDGSYAYHALVLLPDGRLEDPSLTMGMTWEQEFHDRGIAKKYQTGELPIQIRYADLPDVVVIDPESPTGYRSDIEAAKSRTGICTDGSCTNATPGEIAAWGYDRRDVRPADMRKLKNTAVGFRSGRLGRLGRIGQLDSNWANRFLHIANEISYPGLSYTGVPRLPRRL